ncbi:MAG: helix-turn-helix transcriptional regulator [Clostridia bacterium]|nr:helix-turn-helix transcriptional regulator [Clostridia bacterium]
MRELFKNIAVTEIKDIHTVNNPTGTTASISKRKSYGLSFCREGKITYTHNGQSYVEDSTHAVILPKGQSYTLYCDDGGAFPVIDFECAEPLCDTVVSLAIENVNELVADYEKMLSLNLMDGNRLKIMSIFYKILHRIALSTDRRTLIPAVKYIEKNYGDATLSNAMLAKQCRISEVYFRRLFVEQYKTTPRQFIIDVRIGKAKRLLSEGRLKIAAVSELCGFSNQYHFSRAFKKLVGVTPTEYMMNNREYQI